MSAVSLLLRGLSKAVPKKEVAKRGSEVIGRKPEKFMGMADEVMPSRLGGPKAAEALEEGASKAKRLGIGAGLAGAATAAALLSGKDKEKSAGKSYQEDRPVRDLGRESSGKEETKEQPKSSSSFGAAFKAARAEGKDVFTFQGKKYTTEMAGEKKSSKETGVREGRNENIDEDTRKRAMESVANLAKGGAVKKYAKGGMVQANCGASMKPAQSK